MPTMVITELPGREGSKSSVGALGFSKSWRVIAPDRGYHQGTVLTAFVNQTGIDIGYRWQIAAPGSNYYESYDIYLTELRISEESPLTMEGAIQNSWIVTGRWEPTQVAMLTVDSIPPSPADAPIRLERGEWAEAYALTIDNSGNVLQNTAGDRFAEPIDAERHYPLLRIYRRERDFNDYTAAQYRDHVNSLDWTVAGVTYPARTAKCLSVDPGEMKYHQEIGLYYEVKYEFAIRPVSWSVTGGDSGQGWDYRAANVGYRQKVSGSLVVITDSTGQPCSDPRPLNYSTGAALSFPLSSGQAMPMVTFKIYAETDFNQLHFPVSI
jgi:hypothetical protein